MQWVRKQKITYSKQRTQRKIKIDMISLDLIDLFNFSQKSKLGFLSFSLPAPCVPPGLEDNHSLLHLSEGETGDTPCCSSYKVQI